MKAKLKTKVWFNRLWAGQLWRVMGLTGKGYRKFKMDRTGDGEDRRKDKLERSDTKLLRQYQRRYGVA